MRWFISTSILLFVTIQAACSGAQMTDERGKLIDGKSSADDSATYHSKADNSNVITSTDGTVASAAAGDASAAGGTTSEAAATTADQSAGSTFNNESTQTANDSVSPPGDISGAYLHCSTVTPVDKVMEVGCRLDDRSGKRIAIKSIASAAIYTVRVSEIENVVITSLPATSSATLYDNVFQFQGQDPNTVKKIVTQTEVDVSLVMPTNDKVPAQYAGVIKNISVAPPAIDAIFTQIVSGVDSNVYIVDGISGAHFLRPTPSASPNTYVSAYSNCSGTYQASLPKESDIEAIFRHGILNNANAKAKLALQAYSTLWLDSGPAPTNLATYANLNDYPSTMLTTGTQGITSPTQSVLCFKRPL